VAAHAAVVKVSTPPGRVLINVQIEVRVQAISGRQMLNASFSGFDPSLPFESQFCCDAQRGVPTAMW
jgi:hypothetical protein